MRTKWTLLLGAFALGACNITDPPDWDAEYLFPLDFPAVDLSGIPGGTIPVDSVSFTTPVVSQDTDGLVDRILQSEDLSALRAELTLSTTLAVTGSVELSIAASPGNLFSPAQSLTVTVPVSQGSQTADVPVILEVFHGAETLFFQANVVVAGSGGSITVPPGSQIRVSVNFIGTIRVSK
jgi:hypothetical protein